MQDVVVSTSEIEDCKLQQQHPSTILRENLQWLLKMQRKT